MTLSETISRDYITAYKAKNAVTLTVLRLLKTAITNRLVELKQPGGSLTDDEILSLIIKQAKQRRDSIEQYEAANRHDLADKEKEELKILETYLPAQIDDAKLKQIIENAINEFGATGMQDAGKITGAIMSRYKGQVDGKKVSTQIREALARISG